MKTNDMKAKLISQFPHRGLAGIALGCAAFLCLPAAGRAADQRESAVYKTVAGREMKLFIIKPPAWKATDRRPAIVFFHGGGWVGGGANSFVMQSEHLAARGMVCVEVDYRLLSEAKPEEPPLVCVQDAKSAMRWVRSHAAELGIDPRRIAAGGGSAGGHLAAFTGMVEGLDDPQDDKSVSPKADALVLFNPVYDNGPTGWAPARVGDRYQEFSPAHNITADDPPTVVFFGTKDQLVPVKTAEKFMADMKAAGVRCETHYYAGQEHAFFNREPWKTRTLIAADKFLASLGWLKGPPTITPPAATPDKAAQPDSSK